VSDVALRARARALRALPTAENLARHLADLSRTTGINVTDCRNALEARARIAARTKRVTPEAIALARELLAAYDEPAPDSFEARVDAFFAGVKFVSLCNDERLVPVGNLEPRVFPHELRVQFELDWSTSNARYVRIWRSERGGTSRSIHCFIDGRGGLIDKVPHRKGDVLKPASWKKPARHARGNVFDDDVGLSAMGPYGPAYLR
jgi:hypothetical protein